MEHKLKYRGLLNKFKEVTYLRSGRRYKGTYRRGYEIYLSKYKYQYYRKSKRRTSDLMMTIGKIIVLIGILIVFKNTMIFSGVGLSRGMTLGTSCGLAFILFMIGIIVNLCSENSLLGWGLIAIGIIWFFIGIIINLRMVFMPINLLKAIIIFGFIGVGISIIIKGELGKRR